MTSYTGHESRQGCKATRSGALTAPNQAGVLSIALNASQYTKKAHQISGRPGIDYCEEEPEVDEIQHQLK